MKRLPFYVVCIILAFPNAGCGAGSQSKSALSGRVVTAVTWPNRSRLIPDASNSIKVTLATNPEMVKVLPRPTQGSQTTAAFEKVPPGSCALLIEAYPTQDATGVPQAKATSQVTISSGQTTSATVTMVSTIDHLELSHTPLLLVVGQTLALGVAAKDAAGAIVLISPLKLHWASSNSGVVSIDSSGNAKGVKIGSAQITVTESESDKSLVVSIDVSPATSPWPRFRGNLRNSGQGVGGGASGNLRWAFDAGGLVTSSPAIGSDGTIYVGASDTSGGGKVIALNGTSGAKKWEVPMPGGCETSPAIGDNGLLYVTDANNSLHALRSATGMESWNVDLGYMPGNAYSSPLVGPDGTVYVGGASVEAIDGTRGSVKWVSQSGMFVTSSPALGSDGTLYIGSSFDHKMFALDSRTGVKKWEFLTGSSVVSSPAIGNNGIIYVGSMDGKIYALSAASGAQIWAFDTGPYGVWSSPAIGQDGTVYDAAVDGNVYALDGTTGAKKWSYTTTQNVLIVGSPAIGTDGNLYIGSENGALYALDQRTGGFNWYYVTGGYIESSPAIGRDGTIYIGSDDHKVYAIR